MPAAKKTTKKKLTKKRIAKKRRSRKAASNEAKLEQLQGAIMEHCALKNEADAIEDMLDLRRKQIENLMAEMGLTKQEVEGVGYVNFSERRTFKVKDEERLAELMTPRQLAALANITADVYDAAKAEKVAIDEAVIAGKSPSVSINRSRKKLAKERQKKHIAEARAKREDRLAQLRAEWREQRQGA